MNEKQSINTCHYCLLVSFRSMRGMFVKYAVRNCTQRRVKEQDGKNDTLQWMVEGIIRIDVI